MLHNFPDASSSDLLRLAQAGDVECLGRLLSTYTHYLRVLSYARLDARVQSRISTSDVVQDTLLEAHRDFALFSGTTIPEFTGWIRKILIHNLARIVEVHLTAAKRDVRCERSIQDLTDSLTRSHAKIESMLADRARSPSSEAEHHESLMRLASAIESLSAEYKDVIVLRHIEGLPFSKIARQMKRTPGATRMLWLRAIERLRETMPPA